MKPFFGYLIVAATLAATPAAAVEVNVIGLFPGKAVVVVNRGTPRTLSVGQRTPEGVLLVSVDGAGAVVEIDGKRERLEMGQHYETAAQSSGRTTTSLAPDERGHFQVDGSINGGFIRFLVDTGATLVSLSTTDAQRLGIDYRGAKRSMSIMADGRRVVSWTVKLDAVTVGDITLYGVDGNVHEGPGTGYSLLGMSFLGRTDMRREGVNLVLTKRY
jgi:aspartyl protease family protein